VSPTDLDRARLAELRRDFHYNDTNHDGGIDLREFRALLEALEADMSEEEVRIGFAELDLDGDGAIEVDEFLAWWTGD
jgi:Ca2+-binding EF-hand superfamily protein